MIEVEVKARINSFSEMEEKLEEIGAVKTKEEFQEDIYFTIAQSALENEGNITVVGDDDQSLYRFRGATVDLFTNYQERIKNRLGIDVEEINLTTNYRSTENIIQHCRDWLSLELRPFTEEATEAKTSLAPER